MEREGMRSTDRKVQVFMVKDIRNNFLTGSGAEKYLTQVFPRDLWLRDLVSQLCFSQSPQLAPCDCNLGHSMETRQQRRRGAQSRCFSIWSASFVVCRKMVFLIGVVKSVLRRSSLHDKGVTVTSVW